MKNPNIGNPNNKDISIYLKILFLSFISKSYFIAFSPEEFH